MEISNYSDNLNMPRLLSHIFLVIALVNFKLAWCVKDKDGHYIQYESFEEFKVPSSIDILSALYEITFHRFRAIPRKITLTSLRNFEVG